MWQIHVDENGEIIVPAEMLETLGLKEGDEFLLRQRGGKFVLARLPQSAIQYLKGHARRFGDPSESLIEFLKEERKLDEEREAKKLARLFRNSGVPE